MRGSSTSLRGCLLALVLERPGHGYELANRLADRLGGMWAIVAKDIYRLLADLDGEGLLELRVERGTGRRRSRLVYHPTDLTPVAIAEWMKTLMPKEPTRVGIRAKVAVAREQDAPHLIQALRVYEHECLSLAKVSAGGCSIPTWKGLLLDCTSEAVDAQLRCEIEWARRTRQRIGEYVAGRR